MNKYVEDLFKMVWHEAADLIAHIPMPDWPYDPDADLLRVMLPDPDPDATT